MLLPHSAWSADGAASCPLGIGGWRMIFTPRLFAALDTAMPRMSGSCLFVQFCPGACAGSCILIQRQQLPQLQGTAAFMVSLASRAAGVNAPTHAGDPPLRGVEPGVFYISCIYASAYSCNMCDILASEYNWQQQQQQHPCHAPVRPRLFFISPVLYYKTGMTLI